MLLESDSDYSLVRVNLILICDACEPIVSYFYFEYEV